MPSYFRTAVWAAAFLLISSGVALANKGTLDTPTYKITVDVRCEEGEVTCDDVRLVAVNKKTEETIKLKGKTAHKKDAEGTPTQFLGYIFKDKESDTTYFLSEDGQLRITHGDEVILKESGTWTW